MPRSLVSISYYQRRLAIYNLSTFSLADKQPSCYMWVNQVTREPVRSNMPVPPPEICSVDSQLCHFPLWLLLRSEQESVCGCSTPAGSADNAISPDNRPQSSREWALSNEVTQSSIHSTTERAKQVTTVTVSARCGDIWKRRAEIIGYWSWQQVWWRHGGG